MKMKPKDFIDLFKELLISYYNETKEYKTLADISIKDLINKIAEKDQMSADSIIDKLCTTVTNKNNDYSQDNDALSNFYQVEKYLDITAEQGVMVRLIDKIERARNLATGKEQKVKDESLIDTWLDTVAYLVIMNILIINKKEGGTN